MDNLLLITIDQMRAGWLALDGVGPLALPNVTRLARDGVQFLRHFAQATPCGPSRASLYTGQYAFNHRSITNGTPLDARHQTLAQHLRRAGLDPVLFGYTDTSIDPRTVPEDDPRLRSYEGVLPGMRAERLLREDGEPWLDELERRGVGRFSIDEIYDQPLGQPARFPAELSETAFLTESFLEWLESAPAAGWAAHLSYIKPHPPWVAAAPFHDAMPLADVPPPTRPWSGGEMAARHPWLAHYFSKPFGDWLGRTFAGPWGLDAATTTALRRVYGGLVMELDQHFGRLWHALDRRGMLDRTLIVLTSDHGEMLGDHGMIGKACFFPEAFHVPLIIRAPSGDRARGRAVTQLTEHVDLMPTILECFGLPVPRQCDGRSLLGHLAGDTPADARRFVVFEHDFRDLAGQSHRSLGVDDEACGIAVIADRTGAFVHFAGLPPLAFNGGTEAAWTAVMACDDKAAFARLQALMSHRMRYADRRLTGFQLQDAGPIGGFDPL